MNYFTLPGVPLVKPDAVKILNAVAAYLKRDPFELKSKSRLRPICEARQIAMYFIRQKTSYLVTEIGAMFGNRDHTTVIHSVATIKGLMDIDSEFKQKIDNLEQFIIQTQNTND